MVNVRGIALWKLGQHHSSKSKGWCYRVACIVSLNKMEHRLMKVNIANKYFLCIKIHELIIKKQVVITKKEAQSKVKVQFVSVIWEKIGKAKTPKYSQK